MTTMTTMTEQLDLELVLRYAQRLLTRDGNLTDESTLIAGPSVLFPAIANAGYSLALPDMCLDKNNVWRLIECNVTNGAGTSSFSADLPRASHEAATVVASGPLRTGQLVLRAMSPDTRSSLEIKMRSVLLAAELSRRTGRKVQVLSSTEDVGDEPAVVTGTIPDLVRDLHTTQDGTLLYKGNVVRCIFNPNLVTALALRTGTDLKSLLAALPPGVLAEGLPMAMLGLDKVLQQELIPAPLIRPVRSSVQEGLENTASMALRIAAREGGAVIKPLNASGGVSVKFVNPDDTLEDVLALLESASSSMATKYGDNWIANSPWTVSSFVESMPARSPRGTMHRWDTRFQVEITPEWVRITPLSARLCPEPVGDRLTEANAKCNQTGRSSFESVALSPAELINATGMPAEAFERAAAGLYAYFTALFAT